MKNTYLIAGICIAIAACNGPQRMPSSNDSLDAQANVPPADSLPAPDTASSVRNFSKVIGWKDGKMPQAPAGFAVSKFADSLENPRWIYVAPNGDIFVSEANAKKKFVQKVGEVVVGKAKSGNTEKSADRITLFRDTDKDGRYDARYVFLEKLNQPFGMLVMGAHFYVGNTDGVMQFPYEEGQTKISAKGKKILDLPAGGYNNHWTRNLIASPDGSKIFVSVGSGSNVAEHGMENETRRACILEISPDGGNQSVYASGLRNPVGMGFPQGSSTLWTVVNERDELGDELVPDYLTSVKEGAFYGWPYAYMGQHEDPRLKGQNPEMVQKSIAPDYPLGAHTASLGLAFYNGGSFPSSFNKGAFIGQHGSWNRSVLSGYKVIYVPFENGKPAGSAVDFLTGFIADLEKNEVYGRPVGVAIAGDGAVLVADDASNTIWRVAPNK
jgi:glucose/arabinose dehydrogenase